MAYITQTDSNTWLINRFVKKRSKIKMNSSSCVSFFSVNKELQCTQLCETCIFLHLWRPVLGGKNKKSKSLDDHNHNNICKNHSYPRSFFQQTQTYVYWSILYEIDCKFSWKFLKNQRIYIVRMKDHIPWLVYWHASITILWRDIKEFQRSRPRWWYGYCHAHCTYQ